MALFLVSFVVVDTTRSSFIQFRNCYLNSYTPAIKLLGTSMRQRFLTKLISVDSWLFGWYLHARACAHSLTHLLQLIPEFLCPIKIHERTQVANGYYTPTLGALHTLCLSQRKHSYVKLIWYHPHIMYHSMRRHYFLYRVWTERVREAERGKEKAERERKRKKRKRRLKKISLTHTCSLLWAASMALWLRVQEEECTKLLSDFKPNKCVFPVLLSYLHTFSVSLPHAMSE